MFHEVNRFYPSRQTKINLKWHLSNESPTIRISDQGLAWHLRHAVHCGCRSLPDDVCKELENRKIFAVVQSPHPD
jgi:hypothetical protein